jgi:hypothetical protein
VGEPAEGGREVFLRPSRRVAGERDEVSVRAPWRVLAEGVEVGCEASWEDRGGACREAPRDLSEGSWGSPPRGFPEGLPHLRGGSSRRLSRGELRHPGAVPAAVARDCSRGLSKPPARVGAELGVGAREAPSSGRRGVAAGTLRGLARSIIRRSRRAPSRGRPGGRERGRRSRPSSGRRGLRTSSRVAPQASHRSVASGPSWDLGKS